MWWIIIWINLHDFILIFLWVLTWRWPCQWNWIIKSYLCYHRGKPGGDCIMYFAHFLLCLNFRVGDSMWTSKSRRSTACLARVTSRASPRASLTTQGHPRPLAAWIVWRRADTPAPSMCTSSSRQAYRYVQEKYTFLAILSTDHIRIEMIYLF